MIVEESRGPYQLAVSKQLTDLYQEEPTMKLSCIATAILIATSAIASAPAHSQTISVSPQTLVVNFGAAENFLARIRPVAGSATESPVNVPNAPSSPIQASPAPTQTAPNPTQTSPTPIQASQTPITVLPSPPVTPVSAIPALPPVVVPALIGGQKMNADAQRVTKCLIENRGDRYLCGMQELNGEIAKCVGGVGTAGGCFTAPLTRSQPSPAPRQHPVRYIRNYKNYYFY